MPEAEPKPRRSLEQIRAARQKLRSQHPASKEVQYEILAEAYGAAIRERRLVVGYSQDVLCWKSGVDRTLISGIERGTQLPGLVTLYRLAPALRLSPHGLIKLCDEHVKLRKKNSTKTS